MELSGGSTDPLVVPTAELSAVVCRWLKWYRKTEFQDPLGVLKERTGLPKRSIRRVTRCETVWTNYRIADALVVAGMGRPDLLGSVIHIVPNPMWGAENWYEWYSEERCYE